MNNESAELVARLRRHVHVLAGDIGERNVWRPDSLKAAADYIRSELARLDYEVVAQSYRVHDVNCANLEITLPGSVRPAEIILSGAHYDTVQGSPGADDLSPRLGHARQDQLYGNGPGGAGISEGHIAS
ncbi:MAG TPA: hypothetical protein VLN59_11745, partial [Burkholderiales bacterium]|nr:hypothetical protein [Burkholderiales bacterium]